MKQKLNKEQLVKCVAQGLSINKIAKACDVCYSTVILSLKRYGLKTIVEKAHPNLDEDYFKNIDTRDKAYWLGFLYADGCVKHSTKNRTALTLKLELATKDEEQIDKFCEAVRANKNRKTYCTRLKKYHSVSIQICGTFVNNLSSQGCIPNKTMRIRHPNFNNEGLDLAFLLGVYDGDGSVGGYLACGNENFLNDLREKYSLTPPTRRRTAFCLYLPADLRRKMFSNYAFSMSRKRLIDSYQSQFKKTGVRYRPSEKITWPTNEKLKEIVWSEPMSVLGKKLGVSDKAIKKRCIKNGIHTPPKGYWQTTR